MYSSACRIRGRARIISMQLIVFVQMMLLTHKSTRHSVALETVARPPRPQPLPPKFNVAWVSVLPSDRSLCGPRRAPGLRAVTWNLDAYQRTASQIAHPPPLYPRISMLRGWVVGGRCWRWGGRCNIEIRGAMRGARGAMGDVTQLNSA